MHNWLIFQYHRVRDHPGAGIWWGCPSGRTWKIPPRAAMGGRRRVG